MARTVGIGHQDFETIRKGRYFYIDKTRFIKEWWERGDRVSLITRPRRFGKTLNISMLEQFFSANYADRGDLFSDLVIWKDTNYRQLQGTYPVISLSFANIKEDNYITARRKICQILSNIYSKNNFLLEKNILDKKEKKYFEDVTVDMDDVTATLSIYQLSLYLSKYYGKKVIILLDEYDTPMQEAYVNGYWNDLAGFIRNLFNSAFKENPYLERAIMTGITRISKESIFSDLNNLEVITTTSEEYADAFGFTEAEVFAALDEFGLTDKAQEVKLWYDGFTFGRLTDIYNPWSIINYLSKKKAGLYWANTSSNRLIGKLLQEGNREVKKAFEGLLNGHHLITPIDEQIVYDQLDTNEWAIWGLLLASGYLKVVSFESYEEIENDFGQKKELLDENSLIVRFGGGLGNQMFQYALMRNYLLKNQNVYVDLDDYTRPRNGVFELTEVFPNLEIKVCDREQKLNLIERYESGKILNKFIIYNESKFELDKSLLNIQTGIVWGLHQNYYFASLIRNILLDDFKFNIEVDKKLKEQCERLENSKNIVSVHIRRGDYLSPRYYRVLGDICNEIYYNQAMKYMEEQLGNCQFYFFSDDMQWVKQHYSRENAVYIEASMFDSYENWYDMCMMSFCSHNIIANSTFSWWGAWLNKRNDKIVIAPKKWSKTYEFANICPPEWIRI